MRKHKHSGEVVQSARSVLDDLVRRGAQQMLQAALEEEVAVFVGNRRGIVDEEGRRQVVRNGCNPARRIVTGAGQLEVRQPRVRDNRNEEQREHFSSALLPPYLRRSKAVDELIPWLYLKGVSTGGFGDALEALVGEGARGLSATVITRLKEQWSGEYDAWSKRDLSSKEYVYIWVDGIHFTIRLEDDRQCILVVMGATKDGAKELIAVQDGYRESEQSWHELLVNLKHRGLRHGPKLAVGDGALGFWAALRKVFPKVREQRCWVHKMANVLDKLPKSVQAHAKADLHEIWMAPTRKQAESAFNQFIAKYEDAYPKAVACLRKDRETLLTFYDFPAAHWIHLRTTNPIESTLATVRLRHRRTKGSGTRSACLTMVFKLCQSAEKHWRRLNKATLTWEVLKGKKFIDGIQQDAA